MIQLLKLAYRDLGRNRRRSFFSALALGMGLGLLLLMAAVVDGEYRGSMESTTALESGHLQVRSASYDESKASLAWEDLVENPDGMAAQIATLPPVEVSTPRLFASGIVAVGEETDAVRVIGIDPSSAANAPFSDGLVFGDFLTADDREGVLLGLPLAERLSLQVGDKVTLLINTSNGEVDQQDFIVRGLYSTRTPSYDDRTVFLPLAKAQAITRTENHASAVLVLLHDRQQAEAVASALQGAGLQMVTWEKANELLLDTEEFAAAYMTFLYLIVLGITATVIVNTLVMAVFERTREIGILSAIGMRRRRIMAMFFAESGLLGIAGIAMGLVIGGLLVAYATIQGFYIGDMGVTGIMLGDTIYAHLTLEDTLTLTLLAFVITLLAALYPAWLAARMEPVDALRAGQ